MKSTKEERLLFYKKMLRDYRISLFVPKFLRIGSSTSLYRLQPYFRLWTGDGLCLYVKAKHVNECNLCDFEELYKTKPTLTYSAAYWFKPGELRPRIKCIKKAIELCNE